jgi:hypothetical protein
VVERMLLNGFLQERMLTTSKQKEINEHKKKLSILESSTCKKRDKLMEKVRELKKLLVTVKATESGIQTKQGWDERTLANLIEYKVLHLCSIFIGQTFLQGNLVGNSICILMKRGKEIFDKVREHIKKKADKREDYLP